MAKENKEQPAAQPAVPEQPKSLDTGPAGGRYRVNGTLVNANGEPLAELPQPEPDAGG